MVLANFLASYRTGSFVTFPDGEKAAVELNALAKMIRQTLSHDDECIASSSVEDQSLYYPNLPSYLCDYLLQ